MQIDDLPDVAGTMEMTHEGFRQSCRVALRQLQENPIGCDNSIVRLLCEAVRCSRECCELAKTNLQVGGKDYFSREQVKSIAEALELANIYVPVFKMDEPMNDCCKDKQIVSDALAHAKEIGVIQ